MKRALPAIIFLCLTALIRLPILHRSVLDWDESIYFLMARAWLDGHLPYTTIWDNKPPGIYAIFAIFQALIPGIMAIRIAATLCISAVAWIAFEVATYLSGVRIAGWVAGLLLIISSLSNDGLSSNTELFMDFFTISAFLALLHDKSPWLPGLLMGCGFMIKYVCAPEIVVALALLYHRRRTIRAVIESCIALSIPLFTVSAAYWLAGKFLLWWECGIASNFRRAEVPVSLQNASVAIAEQGKRWGSLYFAGVLGSLYASPKEKVPSWFLPAWLVAALIGALGAKSFYDHYFLEVLPPLCVITGIAFARIPRSWPVRLPAFILIVSLPVRAGLIALSQASGPDPQIIAAKELKAAKAKSLYIFDGQPILYALTQLQPPTYYVFPSDIVGNSLAKVAGINPVDVVECILETKPQYIILHSWARDKHNTNGEVYKKMGQALATNYVLWRHINGGINIYKHK